MTEKCPVCQSPNAAFFSHAYDRLRVEGDREYAIQQCRDCRFGWTLPPADEARLSDLYPPAYLGDTERMVADYLAGKLKGTAPWRMETEKVALVERFCSGGTLLDVGCGEGKFLWALDPARWQRWGVELSRAVVDAAAARVPEITLLPGSLASAELPEQNFDVITFWHVLEHVPRPRVVLQRARDLLRPGGRVVISLPNLCSHQARWFRADWYAFTDVPRHLYHFSLPALLLLFEQVGLEFERTLFFSRAVNFHCWKQSARAWTRRKWGSPLAYLMVKPFLHLLPLLERVTGDYGVMTVLAQRAD